MKKLIIIFITLLAGCSIIRPHHQNVKFYATQDNQEIRGEAIFVGGAMHKMPITIKAKRDRLLPYTFEKEGYKTISGAVQNHINFTGILDAVGTGLFAFPIAGLLSPGAYSLDQKEIKIELIKK